MFTRLDYDVSVTESRRYAQKVINVSGIALTLHDPHRTFVTMDESLDISGNAIK